MQMSCPCRVVRSEGQSCTGACLKRSGSLGVTQKRVTRTHRATRLRVHAQRCQEVCGWRFRAIAGARGFQSASRASKVDRSPPPSRPAACLAIDMHSQHRMGKTPI